MSTRSNLASHTQLKDLRIAVLVAESRLGTNRLWEAARERVGELLIIGPDDEAAPLPAGQIRLRSSGPRRHKLTFRHLSGLRPVLDAFSPHLIHVNNEPWGVTSMEMMLRPEPFVVMGAENLFHSETPIERTRMVLGERVVRSSSGYGSWNQPGVNWARSVAGPNLPTLVLPAVIPPAEFVPRTWNGPTDGRFHVLAIGRYVPEKGFDRIIEAIAAHPRREEFTLDLCGAGNERRAWLQQAREQQVDAVDHGMLPPREVAQLMTRMSCLVQPSLSIHNWQEQFGRTVAEAMTVGLPCLASDSGELPRVINDTRCIFAEGSAEELNSLLDGLLNSPTLLVELSHQQAQEAESRWSPTAAATELVDFWQRALERGRSTRH